eukprot:2860184-Alexandrium_andersonii.AAC.1
MERQAAPRACLPRDGSPHVLKFTRPRRDQESQASLGLEANMLKVCRHPNIVTMFQSLGFNSPALRGVVGMDL